jgi:RNase adaptor protein for sRNA GlmZ degradation
VSHLTLIVVTGVPGAGKTTLGSAVATALDIPFVSLDSIKERLYSATSEGLDPFELRLAAEAELGIQLDAVESAVVDIWIAPGRDTRRVGTLLRERRCGIIELLCRVPAEVAVDRYASRRRSGPHRPPDESTLRRIREAVDTFEPMGIGACVEVDTTRPVDLDPLIERLRHEVGFRGGGVRSGSAPEGDDGGA